MPSQTVLITGASGGIGYEMAKLFARDHHNLVLVARSGDRLAQVAAEFQRYGVTVKTVALDLSEAPAPRFLFDQLQRDLGDRPLGINLIHSPHEPDHEAATVELLLRRGVRLVEASAYLDLTLPVVRYRVAGLRRGPDGHVIVSNRIIAKVSRVEVASETMAVHRSLGGAAVAR